MWIIGVIIRVNTIQLFIIVITNIINNITIIHRTHRCSLVVNDFSSEPITMSTWN